MATIGGTNLIPFPDNDTTSPSFVLPDGTVSGVLVIQQGGMSDTVGFVSVGPPIAWD